MLTHAGEFAAVGIPKDDLIELAQAVTSAGTFVTIQNTRSVFVLIYKNIPLAVAITVGSNGFVVGMNRRRFRDLMKKDKRHIDQVGRWKSATGDIHCESPAFEGWVYRTATQPSSVYWEYIKRGTVGRTATSEPKGEWVYTPRPPDLTHPFEDGLQVPWVYWRRYDKSTKTHETFPAAREHENRQVGRDLISQAEAS
jgi:hypothetical protein